MKKCRFLSLKWNKYKKKFIIPFLTLLIIIFMIFPYFVNASILTEYTTIKSSKGHGFAEIRLIDLDFEKRNAKINIVTELFLNTTIYGYLKRVFLNIYSDGVYIYQIPLENIGGTYTFTTFAINTTTTSNNINLYNFKGIPEFYPFDCYRFNITLEYSVEFETFNETYVSLDWSLTRYFEKPIILMKDLKNKDGKTIFSILFEIRRVLWIAYVTFIPLILIYIVLSFSSILHINNDGLNLRLLTYFSILLFIVGESTIIQGSLPKGRFYMAIPEGLILGCTISTILFIMSSLFSYKYSKSAIITDIIATIFSITITIFILISIYIGPSPTQISLLHITPYTLSNICLLQQIVTIGLFIGLTFNVYPYLNLNYLKKLLKNLYFTKKLIISEKIVTNIYQIMFILNICNILITSYIVLLFGSHVESNLFRRLIFDLIKGDFLHMIFYQSLITVIIIVPMYFILKRLDKVLWTYAGILFLAISVPDFINDHLLLSLPEIYIIIYVLFWFGLLSFMDMCEFIDVKN
jgi:hypothetical protein